MITQPAIQPYSREMPDMPAGVVPTTGRTLTLTERESALTTNPVPATTRNLRTGEVYYGYYCLMCHGKKGDGNGPVGEGYVPKPTDLGSSSVTAMTDGQLYSAMLEGAGHFPVMEETVPADQRWQLVAYVRTFASSGTKPH